MIIDEGLLAEEKAAPLLGKLVLLKQKAESADGLLEQADLLEEMAGIVRELHKITEEGDE